jgi:exosome complex component RRP40
VIGIISQVQRAYRVDVGAHAPASLPELAFEGATKKNKPTLQVGDIVYCRLTTASADVEPEVTCVGKGGKAHGLGPLKESDNAFLFTCSLGLCRKLFQPKAVILEALKERGFKFEIVPGMNGRVWVDSTHPYHTIAIANALTLSEFMTDNEIHDAVQKIGDSVMS